MNRMRATFAAAALLAGALTFGQSALAQEAAARDDFAGLLKTLLAADNQSDFSAAAQVLKQVGACRLPDFDQYMVQSGAQDRLAVEFLLNEQLKVSLLRSHWFRITNEQDSSQTLEARTNQPFVTITLNPCSAGH